jgi:hypothetical protein
MIAVITYAEEEQAYSDDRSGRQQKAVAGSMVPFLSR